MVSHFILPTFLGDEEMGKGQRIFGAHLPLGDSASRAGQALGVPYWFSQAQVLMMDGSLLEARPRENKASLLLVIKPPSSIAY